MKKEKLCIGKWLLACVLLPACAWAGTGRPRACPAAGTGRGTAAESLHTPEPAVVPPLRGPHPEKQARTEAASGSGKRAGDRPEHRENGMENKMITRTEPRTGDGTGIGTGDGSENGPRPVRQRASLSVNLADCLDLFTFNMEAGTPVSARWSLTAGFRYNPWTFRRNREGAGPFQRRVLSVRTGVRFWPWHVHSGWFAGSSLGWERYNRGGLFGKKKTVEGDWYGLALSAG